MITPKEMLKPFPITSVCREDILARGYPKKFVEGLKDWEMEQLASKMADAFLDDLYWEVLCGHCDSLMVGEGFKVDKGFRKNEG